MRRISVVEEFEPPFGVPVIFSGVTTGAASF
jgi:hypothetical protein